MKNNKYTNTINAYSKMGEEYLKVTSNLLLPGLNDFLKLIPKNGLALDVGCAGGRDSKRLVKAGLRVVGIDVVDVFLKYAKENVPEAKFKKMDVTKLNFSDDTFDVVLANAILLHLRKKDVSVVLKNLYRVLKVGGKIFIGVKQGKGISYKTDKLSNEKRMFIYYEESEISKIIKESGFKIIFSNVCEDGAGRSDTKWIVVVAEK
ncbi:MAG: class I SAM-dependent methyltransferase [Parcubacteria group bacterium]|jgi:2-polyprenyl-3-methyl-5-hydroxy-6-metoxy-1,4-benzoquinol methylase